MSAAQNESRKRGKKRYVSGQQGKRWKGSRELEVGMQGILITCNMNERKCTAEAFNLLNEYADRLYGPEKLHDNKGSSSSEEEEAEEEEDVDVALKKEVAQLQSSGRKQERRFQALESGANNVIFIKTHNLEPDKLIHHVLSDLHTTKKKKSRVILRMLPVTGTCKAFQEDMLKYLTTFLEPWFKTPNSATYQIAFKARNSSHNKREEIIKSIAECVQIRGVFAEAAGCPPQENKFFIWFFGGFYSSTSGLVGKLNPKNKVDLTNPELTIIVEVIKAVCCVSVARDYTLYRKYNVQEVVKEDAPKADAAKTRTEPNAAEQKDEHNGGEAEEKKVAAEEEEEEKNVAENEEGVNEGEGGGE